jgi:uridine phosphorylase
MTEEFTFQHKPKEEWSLNPPTAVLAFTRKELSIFKELMPDDPKEETTTIGLSTVRQRPDLVLAGPILGAPQAAIVMEVLGRRGIDKFLSLGWCGSLHPELTWGDIILPDDAVSEEGTSAHYPLPGPARPDEALSEALAGGLNRLGAAFTSGRVWTTDAPYRETRDRVARHSADGVICVDMETSALMTVARFRQLAWSGLLVVSDELWGEDWRPGFKSRELKEGLRTAARAVLAAAGCV